MNLKHLAIGVFDSGMGGLTVLKALRAVLPHESFIYLGDTARLPYGTKSPDTVKQYAIQMTKLLVERQIKALVIACNTATTAALPFLCEMLPGIPVIGVVAPGAQAAVNATKNQRIAVLATETTIASGAYQQQIIEKIPTVKLTARACSVLVALAEEGMVTNAVAKEALKHYLQELGDEDVIVLGCTHFPVFRNVLKELVSEHVEIVDSAEATAQVLQKVLADTKLLQDDRTIQPSIRYLVTDSVARFQKVGALFLGQDIPAQEIELVDLR